MTLRRSASPLVLAAGVVLALTACTPAPPAGSQGGQPQGSASETSSGTEDAPSDAAAETAQAAAPLELLFSGTSSTAKERSEKHLALQEGIAECMAEQGFDYPVVPWDGVEEDQSGWTDAELLELGYGFSASVENETEEYEQHPVDALMESMSGAELAAFREALEGPPLKGEDFAEWDPADAVQVPLEDRGCVGKAEHALFGEQADLTSTPQFQTLLNELINGYAAVENDTRMKEAQLAWSECVADAGFPGLGARWDVSALLEQEWAAAWPEEDPSPNEPKLAEFRERELALARADVGCADSTGLNKVRTELTAEADRAFLDLHAEEIEALTAGSQNS
ncbi:MAG: hypothetical protein GX593_14675 [Actinomycetales bacterium]|nr:hypothetical protein [Actinomycetales bacterium]